jgi:hypothetical protein
MYVTVCIIKGQNKMEIFKTKELQTRFVDDVEYQNNVIDAVHNYIAKRNELKELERQFGNAEKFVRELMIEQAIVSIGVDKKLTIEKYFKNYYLKAT